MTKQHLESYLSRSLKQYNDLWYLKLQVMPLAHTQTPADYIVLSKDNKYLVECKECKNDIFSFDRLTQEHELSVFQSKFKSNRSYLLLMFWKERLNKSSIYLIPINAYLRHKSRTKKRSINLKECQDQFMIYKVMLTENNLLNLNDLR